MAEGKHMKGNRHDSQSGSESIIWVQRKYTSHGCSNQEARDAYRTAEQSFISKLDCVYIQAPNGHLTGTANC